MRRVPAAGIRLAFLVFALGFLLGAPCDGGQQKTWVTLLPDASTVGTFSPLVVEIQVSSPTPIQAFEVGLQWDPAMLSAVAVFPHSEFDDDGGFFTSPEWNHQMGRLARVVDLRHGGAGAQGDFKVATLWFMSRGSTGNTSITPTSGGLADGSGNEPEVKTAAVTITIEP
jgi:hypothetical protein